MTLRLRLCLVIVALLPAAAPAATPTTCGSADPYDAALCAYQRRNFAAAEKGFRAIVEADAKDPQTVRATYFLARTLMKEGDFDDASKLFVRIYGLDKSFYDAWSCDYLLGECRRATGQD